jgi:predicted permease
MTLILKQLLIILSTFLIITWFQNIDDKKYNKTRNTLYDKYKFPTLVSAIIGLIINLPELLLTKESCQKNITEFSISTPTQIPISNKQVIEKPTKIITEQQIYTGLPDF